MQSQVSLALTTHNRDRHLPTAIASILNQTYPHFELLLWDDGSNDSTLEIIQPYADRDPRIRIIIVIDLLKREAITLMLQGFQP